MTRDALENYPDPQTGEPVFTNLPRTPDGEVDRDRLGGRRPYPSFKHTSRDGVPVVIDPRPSVPGPGGRPVRPE